MICLNCQKNKSIKHPVLGWLPCRKCTEKQRSAQIKETIELTTEGIKQDRKKYHDDIIQPYRGGTVSKEYIKKYGDKRFTKEEIKGAKNVWQENTYYNPE